MVKLYKNSLSKVLLMLVGNLHIELQTFFSDAIRIVNDRPLTTPSDQSNKLCPINPASFLGQHLAPNPPICDVRDRGDLREDYVYNSTLTQRLWLS